MQVDYINDRDGVIALVKKHLKGEKFDHSLGVEKAAIKLAKRYGADPMKAGLAGLLHDITKQRDNRELADHYKIEGVTEKTLHGPTAVCWLRDKCPGVDEDVLLAIKYHTTGRADMTLLEKIIYVADYIEPARDFPEVEELRKVAKKSLDDSVLMGLEITIRHVLQNEGLIDPNSIAAYNCYRQLKNNGCYI